jgi:hypothetical protein
LIWKTNRGEINHWSRKTEDISLLGYMLPSSRNSGSLEQLRF